MRDLTGYPESCTRSNEGSAGWKRKGEGEKHRWTGEKTQTFNPSTFGLPAPMFTYRTRLVDNITNFGKF